MKNPVSAKGVMRKVEIFVNLALIVVSCLLLGIVIKKTFLEKVAPPVKAEVVLELPGVDWSKRDQTLVLALSANCHYCTESAPLYRQLITDISAQANVRTVAVLPQPTAESQQYLKQLGVSPDEVIHTSLRSIGISATPTLLIVDRTGVISDLWVGRLNINNQLALRKRLHIASNDLATDTSGPTSVDASAIKRAFDRKAPVVIVDVEDREIYEVGHVPGAVNIPLDELEARANDELSPDDAIVVYCRNSELSGHAADVLIKNDGFRRVSILEGGLKQWQAAGYQQRAGKTP